MNAKLLPKIDLTPPENSGINYVWLRMWWMFVSLLLLPAFFVKCGFTQAWPSVLAGLCGVAGGIMPLSHIGIRRLPARSVAEIILAAVGVILLSSAVTWGWKCFLTAAGIEYPEKQQLAYLITAFSGVDRLILFVSLSVVTPLLEEVLFRRMIYSVWYKLHAASAFAGTAALFAAVHGFLPGVPGLFLLGIGFQYLYLRYKNLSAAVFAHMLVNIVAFAANCYEI